MKIKINVEAEMPKVGREPGYKHQSLIEKACEYMDMCEAGEADDYHFKYLKCLYKRLNDRPRIPNHMHSLMAKLTNFMIKHAGQDSGEDQLDVEGVDIFRYNK